MLRAGLELPRNGFFHSSYLFFMHETLYSMLNVLSSFNITHLRCVEIFKNGDCTYK